MIHYIKGDATRPIGEGRKIIAHICNNIGAWGAGFTKALSQRWEKPEKLYRDQFGVLGGLVLGSVHYSYPEDNIIVANMIAQNGVRSSINRKPLILPALQRCLRDVASSASATDSSIHMPRIGCGLAGGKWEEVLPIIEQELAGVEVYVYDLDQR